MPFIHIPDRVRKNPLSRALINALHNNLAWLEGRHLTGHAPDGYHNAVEIPRAIASINYSGAVPSLEGTEGLCGVSIDSYTTGTVVITLDDPDFVPSPMLVRAQSQSNDLGDGPCSVKVQPISATQFRLRHFICAAPAAGTNSWAAHNGAMCFAVHGPKYEPSTSLPTEPDYPWGVRKTLDAVTPTGFNQLLANVAAMYNRVRIEHFSTGEHDLREVARWYLKVIYESGAYSIGTGHPLISTPSVDSDGFSTIDIAEHYGTPLQTFVMPDWRASGNDLPTDIYVAGCRRSDMSNPTGGSTRVKIVQWKFDAGTKNWTGYHGDYGITIYG